VNGPAPIGHAVPGVREYLLDDELQPVADGEIGNLYVGGVGLAVGYDGLPELTADAFPTLSREGRPQRVYRTGDRAYRRGDGQLVFVGVRTRSSTSVVIASNRAKSKPPRRHTPACWPLSRSPTANPAGRCWCCMPPSRPAMSPRLNCDSTWRNYCPRRRFPPGSACGRNSR
jgi:hypothetical protein